MAHGGDVYNNRIELDYSVNVSMLGVPKNVKDRMLRCMENISRYPEYDYQSVRKALAEYEACDINNVLCTNGASEAFMAVAHAFMPKRALLAAPGFYGYEYCLKAVDCSIEYCQISRENMFELGDEYLDKLDSSIDMIFLGNPNNPTGRYIDENILNRICRRCMDNNITLVIDECFYLFGRNRHESINRVRNYPNVIVVNAFTKVCALAGIRAGYVVADGEVIQRISRHLPEWNVSVMGAEAIKGCIEVLEDDSYQEELREAVSGEREYLTAELRKIGIEVFDSQVNFLLIRSDLELYERLKNMGILIRECSDYQGLDQGYYRIAVMNRQDNVRLLESIKEIME